MIRGLPLKLSLDPGKIDPALTSPARHLEIHNLSISLSVMVVAMAEAMEMAEADVGASGQEVASCPKADRANHHHTDRKIVATTATVANSTDATMAISATLTVTEDGRPARTETARPMDNEAMVMDNTVAIATDVVSRETDRTYLQQANCSE